MRETGVLTGRPFSALSSPAATGKLANCPTARRSRLLLRPLSPSTSKGALLRTPHLSPSLLGFQQLLQLGELRFKVTLGWAGEDRSDEFEEATRMHSSDEGNSCTSLN